MNRLYKDLAYGYFCYMHKVKDSWLNRYMPTEMFVIKDDKLYNIVEDVTDDELYIVINDKSLLVYQAHLDGETIGLQEAKEKYPEEFI